ncbi:glycosyltransferase family 4 protein [Donghicola tyrosinivorans]|uniref:Glycosyltransferase involved in cell wall biosynthesis n=1 Tax=Donghicola tyrosinivorans TaxID=1652492 RepID=A0A2T0WDG9_9RHOB|nr:glycosyltransferase family 4 protein [Donghicola tyrosinivorans]PRY84715.1 glycosyltransferase involved in cell wall biosynthesis [Donghicola tyrosinivorans]
MKIAIISSTFPTEKPGGVPTYVDGRATFLSRKVDVRVYALGQVDSGDSSAQYKQVSLGPSKNFKKNFLFTWMRLLREIRSWRPDVIEIHNIPVGLPIFALFPLFGMTQPTYFFHGPARLEAKIEGASRIRYTLRYYLEHFCLRRSRVNYCVSQAFRNVLLEEHSFLVRRSRKVAIRYPRIKLPHELDTPTAQTPESERLSYICVRRLVERTGTAQLLDAFLAAKASKSLPSGAVLRIVGDGPQRPILEEKIKNKDLSDSVELLGHVSQEERDRLFATSNFNVVPTIGLEGFGLVVVEAAFWGCPSIVTDVNALPEVISKLDGIGVVVPPTQAGLQAALKDTKPLPIEQRHHLAELARRKFGVS